MERKREQTKVKWCKGFDAGAKWAVGFVDDVLETVIGEMAVTGRFEDRRGVVEAQARIKKEWKKQ